MVPKPKGLFCFPGQPLENTNLKVPPSPRLPDLEFGWKEPHLSRAYTDSDDDLGVENTFQFQAINAQVRMIPFKGPRGLTTKVSLSHGR